MIKITVYKDSRSYTGFKSEGHAGYAEEGYDIICAAVSVLTVNTINSIESFTSDTFHVKQKDGFIECRFDHPLSSEAVLLMNSMILGLQEIEKDYGHEYIRLIFKEV
ncbi:MAG TPA: ribosomal-processing cysteine protease Prp [Candidatus Scybalocola faecavium]|nr:ribosomal-processing cysteine protease Prp [Candidatus Scybalocola faecavium]